ncbi:hypothetical protein DLAC_03296 [Tieghemostelium lacteum]|uniref:Uncharacterized protein n=1 Tax=Tieghemostelium lacteum TaxID=361077 RepID=A0A152A1Q9_TIELA|nr:hypothetical protein DLAC_03296 [Tieghemostelium lacteum]|eukprot:KYR00144.1 hypothetical protein DLAC_03296 [Tieghemostelium lacteum]
MNEQELNNDISTITGDFINRINDYKNSTDQYIQENDNRIRDLQNKHLITFSTFKVDDKYSKCKSQETDFIRCLNERDLLRTNDESTHLNPQLNTSILLSTSTSACNQFKINLDKCLKIN